jgi:N-carbamoylputrescine amidase
MSSFKIALLQMTSHGADRAANLAKGEVFCRRAAAGGADLALFPELWSVGYSSFDAASPDARAAWLALAVGRDDPFVVRHRDLARELDMAIAVTYLERWPGAPRNAVTIFDRLGQQVLSYAKVHLCPWGPPDDACTAGSEFPVARLVTAAGPVRVGAMICFDREFPEAARMLMLNGAELILTPNACDLDDRASGLGDVRIAQFRARAFENLVAVAMTNYAGPQYDGRSVAFGPDGATVVQAGCAEEVVFADIDLAKLRAFREREKLRDTVRCPEKYGAIASAPALRPIR